MISFDEAVELVRSIARPLGSEKVDIAQAAGRVLAAPVIAAIDSPRSNVSAMDGYAIREADLEAGTPLRVIGESFAGAGWDGDIAAGTCARIFTGAPVPRGADRVIMQENIRREGELALIETRPGAARHIRKRGSDFGAGAELLSAGRLLDPRAIVAAAAADVALLDVVRKPRLAILSTGDELAEPGQARSRADAIPESVSFGVAALAEQWGAAHCGTTRLRDDLEVMKSAAASALDGSDIVVVTGGASVGEKDFAKAMFEPFGLELIFSKIAIKPGKPVWLGRAGKTLVVGLPGNPTSAMVTGRLVLAPLLAGIAGRSIDEALRWRTAPLLSDLGECGARETFHRAQSEKGGVRILAFQDSSAQKALAAANVLVRQRAGEPAKATGETVEGVDF